MKNVFDKKEAEAIIDRIHKLMSNSKPLWGKMTVEQMLAHCNITYEMVYDSKHKKPNVFIKFILKTFVKNKVVNEASYKQNNPTGPQFIIKDKKYFEEEMNQLIGYINKTQELGEYYFDNKESHSFGKLTKTEWNNMFYKHLDHHLKQYGV